MASAGQSVDADRDTPAGASGGSGADHDPRDVAHLHEDADFDWVATPDLVPRRHPRVASVEVDGRLVLTHPEAPDAVLLDAVSTILWRSFADGVTVRDLAEDVVDALEVEPQVALTTMTDTATSLGRSGFLTEPPRPPLVRRARVLEVGTDTCAGRRLGLDRIDPGSGLVVDTGERLLRVAATDPALVDWLAEPFHDRLAAADDPRRSEPVELIAANQGAPAPNRRSRLRLLDHFGTLWFGTFDPVEAAEALGRTVQDRLDAAQGGTWLRAPVLVPADADPDRPVPALVLHPWLSLSLDRLLPGLRRLGVAIHPSPLVRLDLAAGGLPVTAGPRLPEGLRAGLGGERPVAGGGRGLPTADPCTLVPVALVGVWDDLDAAEVLQRFAPAAARWDQAHLDAVADLAAQVPYVRLDARHGLRSTTAQLAGFLAGPAASG